VVVFYDRRGLRAKNDACGIGSDRIHVTPARVAARRPGGRTSTRAAARTSGDAVYLRKISVETNRFLGISVETNRSLGWFDRTPYS